MKDHAVRKPVVKTPGIPAACCHTLHRQVLWAALTLALGLPTAQAQTVPDGATRTRVIAAANGVPVVNIAAPNRAGVSHNTYKQFNVASNGQILNNSGAVSKTQLAGYVYGNPNLTAGQSASLILNEVTSTSPSQLNGAMEVAGHSAQVVVANPNGISCNGCGFINAPRGTLTTGTPVFGSDGSLSGLAVTGGTITIQGAGLPGSQTDEVDLLARAVAVNAGVWANQLNVVTGPNRIDYTTLATQPLSATGTTPTVSLDVSALGGMYAHVIRLIGTEAGLGVNSQGQIAATDGTLMLTSAGQVVLGGPTSATGNLTINAARGLTSTNTLASGGSMTLASGGDLTSTDELYSAGAMTLSADGTLGNSGTIQTNAGNLTLDADTLANTGILNAHGNSTLEAANSLSSTGSLLASGNVALSAAQITTAGTVQAGAALALSGDTLSNSGKLYALGGSWTTTLTGAFVNLASGDVYGSQGLTLQAASLANAGGIEAQQADSLSVGGDLNNSGKLQSDKSDITLNASTLSNSGTVSAARNLQWQVGAAAQNSGVLVSGQALGVSSGSFDNASGGHIQSGTDLSLAATTLNNEGSIDAKGDAVLTGSALSNASGAQLIAAGALTMKQAGNVSNAGVLQAGTDLAMAQAAALDNATNATIYAGQNLQLGVAQSLTNAGTLYAANAATLTAGSVDNAGTLAAAGNTTLDAGSLSGNGTLAAGLQGNGSLGSEGDLSITTTGNLASNGRALAAGSLHFVGSAIDLSHSQTRAGSTIILTASQGNVTNAAGNLAANGTVTLITPGSLINGGTTAVQGGVISAGTFTVQAAAIDNQYGTLTQTGTSDLDLSLTGAFDNANGHVSTNAQNVSLDAASIDNTAGTIQQAGSGTLALTTSGDLTNTAGTIEGNGALSLQSGGTLGNAGGVLSVSGTLTAQADTLDNMQGTLIGNNVGLTIAQALTNTAGGTIQAGGSMNIGAGSLDNTAGFIKVTDAQSLGVTTRGALTNGSGGFIGGNGATTVNALSLVNAGQIYAGTTLGVSTQGNLTNNGGALQAQGAASITSDGALGNRAGAIEAGGGNATATLNLSAASLDNTSGRIADTGQGGSAIAIAQSLINEGGTLGGQGALTVSASSLDNSHNGHVVAGQGLSVGAASLNNTGGNVYAAGNLAWNNGGASLENAQGSMQAGGDLSLTLASLDNAGGTLASNDSGDLTLGDFTGIGKVAAGQNLSLTLGGNYTNAVGNQLSANNNLSLNVAGHFSNAAGATLQAVNALTLSAAGIDNAAGATVNSASTTLSTSGALTNEGSIEGSSITLDAGSLTNTANIIGGTLTATAGTLTNGADLGQSTSNNPYQSGLIAATSGINLYVSGTLLNRDATIFTLGDLTMAGDAHGDPSAAITNLSGDIEASGNVTLDATQFTNQRRVFQTQTLALTAAEQAQNTTSATLARYFDTNPAHQPPNVNPEQVIGSPEYSQADSFCNSFNSAHGSQRCDGYPFGNGQPNTFQGVYTSTVTAVQEIAASSAQSKLMAGGNITLNGSVLNAESTIAAGNDLIINGQNGSQGGGSTVNTTVQNIAFEPTATVQSTVDEQSGTQVLVQSPSRAWIDGPWVSYGSTTSSSTISLASGSVPSWISFNPGSDAPATMSAGNTVSITAQTISNTAVGANGQPVQAAIGLGSNGAGQAVSGNAATAVGNASGNGGSIAAITVGQATDAGHTALAPPQVVSTLVGPNATINLPQTGLYTVNVQPGSQFLVETNPQFTQYSKFISSNYLLQQLGLNPATTEQRLGDGFYEQQQVLDQITDLTGRRYLADDTDALDQYRDLMNNAVGVAQSFNLSVGVALTPAQMANLTQDIVWLVNVTVDGHQVLEPVVYLSAADAKRLAATGATIAGKNVILTASGDLTNNGTIAASQNAQLTASNLLNSGTISAGNNLSLTAAQNILNGGTLHAGGNVSLVAGNDVLSGVRVAQSLGGVALPGLGTAMGPVALTSLALPGSITAGGNLSIAAGRDLSLDTAPVAAGGNLSLAASRDLTATAAAIHAGGDAQLLAGRDLSLLATASTNRIGTLANGVETSTHTVDAITAGGTLSLLAGHDLASQGAQLTGTTLALAAGHDVNLQAVTDSTTRTSQGFQGHTLVSTGQSDQSVRGTTLTGSNGLGVSAGHDLTITAGNLSSANGNVALAAGHDLALNAAQEDHSSYRDTVTSHSSLFSSSKTTTHDATTDSYAIGTAVSGNNVILAAGHDLTTQAAQLEAAQGLALSAGHDVTLGAGEQTHTSEHGETHTSSSLFNTSATRFGSLDPEQYSRTSGTATAQTWSIGSTLSGDTVTVAAGHDLTGTAVQIAGTHDVTLAAGNDLTLNAGQDTYSESDGTTVSRTGLMNGGGFSALIGNRTTQAGNTVQDTSYTGSLVGSTNGAVTLTAGHNVHITGSDVLSQTATTIVGQNVTIDAAVGSTDTTQTQSVHTGGIHVGLSGGAVSVAQSVYGAAQGASHSGDSRLKALYAMQAAQTLYSPGAARGLGLTNGESGAQTLGDAVSDPHMAQGKGDNNGGSGINLQVGITGSTARSESHTHDDTTYGSAIRSNGNVTIAATNGDLNVIGSQVSGQNVALAASHDLNLLSQAEQHTDTNHNSNASGGVGISIGSSGFGFYAQAALGQGKAHGNGTTHTDTAVNAADTLSLVAGNDATIQGAQAKGSTVLADVGHNLNVISEQDTNDYASTQWQAAGQVVIGVGSSASGSFSLSQMDSHYKSVTQMSGIGAGGGGFDIHVGGNTDLKGAVIASTADPSKNLLDTGSLTYSNLQNEAKYSATSVSVGSGGMAGLAGLSGLAMPQGGNASSTTQAGIAQGTVVTRDNASQDLGGLNRGASLDNANGVTNNFNPQKIAANQQLAQVAGQVGMTAVGDIAAYMANHATAEADQKAWSDGGANKALLHGLVGAAVASLGGNNALQGGLGAAASEKASGVMGQYLVDHGISPYSPEGKSLLGLASAAIGGAVGGGAGATTALQGEQYNRQLHPDETAWIKSHAAAFAQQQCGCDPGKAQIDAATAELSQQALKDVDLLWRSTLSSGNDAVAQQFLAGAQGSFVNEAGQPQGLFTAQGSQYLQPALYADGADRGFYQAYVQPGVTRTALQGLAQETGNAALALQDQMLTNPLWMVQVEQQVGQGLMNGLQAFGDHPGDTVKGWFGEGGNTLGETAGAWGGAGAANLNALYGQDVTSTQRTLQGLDSVMVLGNAIGAGKVAGEVGEQIMKGAMTAATKAAIAAGDVPGVASDLLKQTLSKTWKGDAASLDHFMQSITGNVGAINGFESADSVNATMGKYNWAPAWMPGTQVADATLNPGTVVNMVVDKATYDALTTPGADVSRAFGGWGTLDDVSNQAYARNSLAITSDMKKDVSYVIQVEVTQPVNAQIGIVGSQDGATGGGNQLHFNLPPDQRSSVFKFIGGGQLQ